MASFVICCFSSVPMVFLRRRGQALFSTVTSSTGVHISWRCSVFSRVLGQSFGSPFKALQPAGHWGPFCAEAGFSQAHFPSPWQSRGLDDEPCLWLWKQLNFATMKGSCTKANMVLLTVAWKSWDPSARSFSTSSKGPLGALTLASNSRAVDLILADVVLSVFLVGSALSPIADPVKTTASEQLFDLMPKKTSLPSWQFSILAANFCH